MIGSRTEYKIVSGRLKGRDEEFVSMYSNETVSRLEVAYHFELRLDEVSQYAIKFGIFIRGKPLGKIDNAISKVDKAANTALSTWLYQSSSKPHFI